ncbi:hypothetical protein N9Y42_06215 [Mariniblastus sp.]|nr:hypothetical protein [Mariniblastus sp.]
MQTISRRPQLKHLTCLDHEGTEEAATAALTAEVASAGLAKSDVVVVVCRSDVELRLLDVPPAPESELPAMVKFVAKNEFASLNDNWVLDFVRLSGDAKEPGKVLAAGLSPEHKKRIEKSVEAAGLRLKQIVFRPLAVADYLASQLTGDGLRVLIDHKDDSANISLFNGRSMFATRTIRLVGSNLDKTLEREVKRTVAVAHVPADQLSEILLVGPKETVTPLGESLSNSFSKPHRVIDPTTNRAYGRKLRSVDQNHRYIPLLGTFAELPADTTPGMDFLNPRQVEIKKTDFSKWYLYGGVAAVGVLLLFGYGYLRLSQQASKIAERKDRLDYITSLNNGDKGRPAVDATMKKVGEIDDWVTDAVNWQDTLLEYSEHALTADDTIVDSLIARQKGSTQLTIKARVADAQTKSKLVNELQKQPDFVTTQKNSEPINDREFAIEARLEIGLARDRQQLLREIDARAEAFMSEQRAARSAAAQTNTPSN